MSTSAYQDFAIDALLKSIGNRGNKAMPDRKPIKGTYETEYSYPIDRAERWRRGKAYCRVDLYLELEFGPGAKETVFVECKRDTTDLNSGYGLNFYGDVNFLLIPTKSMQRQFGYYGGHITMQKALDKLSEIGATETGILILDKGQIVCARKSRGIALGDIAI